MTEEITEAEPESEPESRALTLFDIGEKERRQAIRNLIKGKTPLSEIKKRPMRGGGQANYVNTYYMTRQAGLISGFRWGSDYLEDKARPNWDDPVEVGVKVKVTIWDNDGKGYSHTCWGGKDVMRYGKDDLKGTYKKGDIISLFDDLKAAESDAIKKALSYFGIANDIYGGKELEYFSDDSEQSSIPDINKREFGKFLTEKHILVSRAKEILQVEDLDEIVDFKVAHDVIVKELGL